MKKGDRKSGWDNGTRDRGQLAIVIYVELELFNRGRQYNILQQELKAGQQPTTTTELSKFHGTSDDCFPIIAQISTRKAVTTTIHLKRAKPNPSEMPYVA